MSYLSEFFKTVIQTHKDSLVECVYLCLNKIGPEYDGVELGIGESIIMKAVAKASGRTPASLKQEMIEVGDLGTITQVSCI